MSATPLLAKVEDVPLELVDDPKLPSRAEMDDEKMQQLVESIRQNGIVQNLVLVQRGDRYEVVAGHRRTIAARLAGLLTVPARVYPPDFAHLRVIQAHENGRREDVNPVDEALWFAELLATECGNDVTKLVALVGETQGYVLGRLELCDLDDETRDALRAGLIGIGVALSLRKCDDSRFRHYFLQHAIKGGATRAIVDSWIADWRKNIVEPGETAPPPAPAQASVGPSVGYDPMRCFVCGRSDHRIPEQIAIHSSCREAILEPMLRDAAGERS